MESSDIHSTGSSGTRSISERGVLWDNSQESLPQTQSSSQVRSDGVTTMQSVKEKPQRGSSPARTELLQKIRESATCLDELPDDWLERILDEPTGLDDVYELAASDPCSRKALKCLLHLRMERTEALACSLCKVMFSNHIHYLAHISMKYHAEMVAQAPITMNMKSYVMWKDMLDIFARDVESWMSGDSLYVDGDEYYKILGGDESPSCRPSKKWINDIYPAIRQYSQKKWTSEAKENILIELHRHLEEGSPTCHFCKKAFDNAGDYYRHCSTFVHVECVQAFHVLCDDVDVSVMKTLTLLLNGSVRCAEYFDHARIRNNDDPDSLNNIYESSAAVKPHIPPCDGRRGRTGLGREREMHILETIKPSLNGLRLNDLRNVKDGATLRLLVEPCLASFSSLARRIFHSSNDESPLSYFEQLEDDELSVMYKVAIYTLEQGLPFCLYCDRLFKSAVEYCNHLMTRTHNDNFSNFSSVRNEEGTSMEDVQEVVHMLILESSKRREMDVSSDGAASSHPNNLLPLVKSTNPHFYCDICCRPFVSFTFYIAHYWSLDHLASDRMPRHVQYPPEYVALLIRHSTKDQRSRISQRILDKYASVNTPFVAESFGIYTRDVYLTYYVHFHFEKKYLQWRERQSYQREKGTPTVFDDKRHVPEPKVQIEVDENMRAVHKRSPYEWWTSPSSEYVRFRNYFFTFPPTLIWKTLFDNVNKKGKIPFCSRCKMEFRSVDDYFLHFGLNEHPNPTSMDESLAGISLLVHIMYSENAVGADLDNFHNVVSF